MADFAAVATALAAGGLFWLALYERVSKRLRLEKYLKEEKASSGDKGQRTPLHLSARLGMTESEIMDAAFSSGCIEQRIIPDQEGKASALLLEYSKR